MFFVTRPRPSMPSLYWSRSVPPPTASVGMPKAGWGLFIETVAMALSAGLCGIKMSKEESINTGPFDLQALLGASVHVCLCIQCQ